MSTKRRAFSVKNALIQAQQDSSKQCQLLMYLYTTLDTWVLNKIKMLCDEQRGLIVEKTVNHNCSVFGENIISVI